MLGQILSKTGSIFVVRGGTHTHTQKIPEFPPGNPERVNSEQALTYKAKYQSEISITVTIIEHNMGTPQLGEVCVQMLYSRLPITRTFRGNRKRFELSGVRVTVA